MPRNLSNRSKSATCSTSYSQVIETYTIKEDCPVFVVAYKKLKKPADNTLRSVIDKIYTRQTTVGCLSTTPLERTMLAKLLLLNSKRLARLQTQTPRSRRIISSVVPAAAGPTQHARPRETDQHLRLRSLAAIRNHFLDVPVVIPYHTAPQVSLRHYLQRRPTTE